MLWHLLKKRFSELQYLNLWVSSVRGVTQVTGHDERDYARTSKACFRGSWIMTQVGWLESKHATMYGLCFDPKIEISMPNTPNKYISKSVTFGQKWMQKLDFFVILLRDPCRCPLFPAGNIKLAI
jgi:hypothetical protein